MRPIILCIDDTAGVLDRLRADLRRRYRADYEVVGYRSPGAALARMDRLGSRGADVALLIADHWMPGMTGVELLTRSRQLCPTATRTLLVDLGDSSAAEPMLRAMALGQIDSYMIKPWGQPEDRLYPAVGEALRDWSLEHRPRFEVARIVAPDRSARAHELRDVLERNGLPTGLYGPGSAEGLELLSQAGCREARVPVVLLFDGRVLVDPTNEALATSLGARRRPLRPDHDVAIVGAGPAGLGAAVYAASEGLDTVVLEREAVGGQAGTSSRIRNYLGFPRGLTGLDLASRAR